ncbi:MAG TPA: hypothetical protein VGK45_17755, partial [Thermoanaerobaculia bacterium]
MRLSVIGDTSWKLRRPLWGKPGHEALCYPVVQEKNRADPIFLFLLTAGWKRIASRNDPDREHAMSKSAAAAVAPLPFELVYSDGEPLET